MIKNFLGIIAIAAMLTSCGTATDDKKSGVDETAAKIEFASLIETPTDYLDKVIEIEGSVVHVCTHTGKKMFIVGENPDIRLFITADEEVPKFPMELLGSKITVTDLSMVEAGEKKGEGNHMEEAGETSGEEVVAAETGKTGEAPAGEDCETEAAVAAQPVLAEYVLHYKSHLVK